MLQVVFLGGVRAAARQWGNEVMDTRVSMIQEETSTRQSTQKESRAIPEMYTP